LGYYNHKPSNSSAFNDNPYELPMKILLDLYLGESDCYV